MTAFQEAQPLIASMDGFLWLQLHRCLESPDRFLLLVGWASRGDHMIGFRQSSQQLEWKRLLHHFYEPFPPVEHYESLVG